MSPSRVTRGALVGALMVVAAMMSPPLSSATPGLTATELKAIFLLRLPQFVEWPDGRTARMFCVAEAPELSRLLGEMLAAEPRGRTVRVVQSSETTTGCDVVFGVDAMMLAADDALEAMLWVNDQPGYAQGGGMVELARRGARIGLVVNLPALESVGLRASSKLLQLSDVIEGAADGN